MWDGAVAQQWGQAQSAPETPRGTFLEFSSPAVLRCVPGSIQAMLVNVPDVSFLQASLNLRNWVFLMISKPGLMTAKSSTAVALQARGALSGAVREQ